MEFLIIVGLVIIIHYLRKKDKRDSARDGYRDDDGPIPPGAPNPNDPK